MKAPQLSKPNSRSLPVWPLFVWPLRQWPLHMGMVVLCFLSFIVPSAGQCGNTLSSRSYDTLITGPGYGVYTLSFPKWNPDSGTLVSVKLTASVSQQYGFTLKNADISPSTYSLLVGRYDQFSSAAMSTPFTNTNERNIGIFSLQPGASVTSAPFPFLQNYANTDSITGAVAPFAGAGTLSFNYAPITYTDVHTNNNASYSYLASANDSIHFSISYQFCTTGLLASSLIGFTAAPEGSSDVKLSWTMANEEAGRIYEVQVSRDGAQFTSAGSLSSIGGGRGNEDYHYDWKATSDPLGKWYFRIKVHSADGRTGYSEVRQVVLGTGDGGGLRLYPNPASDFVYIDFDGLSGTGGTSPSGDWQIELFSADGRRIQSEFFSNTSNVRLDFRHALAHGTYFIRATDCRTNMNYNSSLLVR